MFGFGEEEEYEQQPRRSFFGSIGNFLLNALKIAAVVALAIVAIVTLSDKARDTLNDLTKDKDGKGGWGDGIRKNMGLAQEKAGNMFTSAKEYLAETFPSAAKSLAETKQQAVETANTAENAALAGAAALAARSVYNRTINPNIKGKINPETGEFEALSRKERKAVKEAAELKAKQEAAKQAQEKAAQEAKELRAKADEAKAKYEAAKEKTKAAKTIKGRFSAAREFKAANEAYIKADSAAQKAESTVTRLGKKITKLDTKIASNAGKLPKEEVITRGDYKARNAPAGETTAHPSPSASSKELVVRPSGQVTVIGKDGKTIVDITDRQKPAIATASGTTSTPNTTNTTIDKPTRPSFLERHPRLNYLSRVLKPLAIFSVVSEGTSQALGALNSGNHGDATATALKTTAEAGLVLAAPELAIIKEGVQALANTSPVKDTIESGTAAYLKSKLSPDQQDAVKAWKAQAQELGLNVPETHIIRKIMEQKDLDNNPVPPSTPNTLLSNNGQTQSPAKGN